MPTKKKAKKAPPKVSKAKAKETRGATQPSPKEAEKRLNTLIEALREGMPSVSAMKQSGLGVLRKHKEWERHSRPILAEMESILGRPVSAERYRPGRDSEPL